MTAATDLERHLAAQVGELAAFERFFWHRLRSDWAIRALAAEGLAAPTVLDVGAGAGLFATHLRERAPAARYAFVEPIAALAEGLRARHGAGADWSARADWRDADAVVLLDVLEHQADDATFLRALVAKLRPGALVAITCPALDALWSDWDVRLGHFRRYRLGPFRRVVAGAGLELVASRYLFQAMVLPGLVRRLRGASGAEFPAISPRLNELVYRLGRVEQAALGWVPFGSSVAALARVR